MSPRMQEGEHYCLVLRAQCHASGRVRPGRGWDWSEPFVHLGYRACSRGGRGFRFSRRRAAKGQLTMRGGEELGKGPDHEPVDIKCRVPPDRRIGTLGLL